MWKWKWLKKKQKKKNGEDDHGLGDVDLLALCDSSIMEHDTPICVFALTMFRAHLRQASVANQTFSAAVWWYDSRPASDKHGNM